MKLGSNDTLLHEAIKHHDHSRLKQLLMDKANPDSKVSGVPLLLRSISDRDIISIKLLIEAGANVNVAAGGECLIHTASKFGDSEIVEILISAGAFVDARDSKGWTALMHCAQLGSSDIIQLLIESGSNVNLVNRKNETALDLAVSVGRAETSMQLLQLGANVEDTLFFKSNKKKLINWLQQEAPVLAALLSWDNVKLQALIEKNPPAINFRDRSGDTLLMTVAFWGHMNCVSTLIRLGADINAIATPGGQTALTYAVSGRNIDILKYLLEQGADPTAGSAPPIVTAIIKGDIESVAVLLDFANRSGIRLDYEHAVRVATKLNQFQILDMLRPYVM